MLRPVRRAAVLAAGAGLAAGAAIYGAYRLDLAARHRQLAAGGRIADTRVGPIEYAVRGAGPPALVIHGAGGGCDQGLMVASGFVDRCRVIAPSRFGYLGTPRPKDASAAAQAGAHAALLDTLRIDRAIVLGVSAGAPSAVELALRYPERVRALILLVPMGHAPDHTPGVKPTLTNKVVLRLIYSGADFAYWSALRVARRAVVRFMGVPPDLEAQAPEPERQRICALMAGILPLSPRRRGLEIDAAMKLDALPVERITAPALLITAKDDLFGTLPAARFLAERIPAAKLVVFDTGGHLLVGRQNEVNVAIAEFLASVAEAEADTGAILSRGASARGGAPAGSRTGELS